MVQSTAYSPAIWCRRSLTAAEREFRAGRPSIQPLSTEEWLMDVFEAIATTRAMRRLDPTRDVADADILTIVEAATKAATGGNSQPVR